MAHHTGSGFGHYVSLVHGGGAVYIGGTSAVHGTAGDGVVRPKVVEHAGVHLSLVRRSGLRVGGLL